MNQNSIRFIFEGRYYQLKAYQHFCGFNCLRFSSKQSFSELKLRKLNNLRSRFQSNNFSLYLASISLFPAKLKIMLIPPLNGQIKTYKAYYKYQIKVNGDFWFNVIPSYMLGSADHTLKTAALLKLRSHWKFQSMPPCNGSDRWKIGQ